MEETKRLSSNADGVFLLPRSALKHIKDASASDLKVLMYICSTGGVFDDADACESCSVSPSELQSAIGFWRGAKVLRPGDAAEEIPRQASLSKVRTIQEFDAETLASARESDKDFATVCFAFSRAFNKHTPTRNDLNSLYYLYNYVSLPADLICAIIEYCVENDKKSLHYLVKTALSLYEENEIDTEEKFTEYMRLRRKVTDSVSKLREMLGIGSRAFTSNEKQYVERWFAERMFSFELVAYAYDITVDKIGKFNFKYANSILERWFSEGVTTRERAEKEEENWRAKNAGDETNETFDFDELFEIASKRKLD